jgi:7-cyano-7-deazaguanine tRNA-ribosyltransferase
MFLVVGISLRNLVPRFWDPESPYHLPGVDAVMVSTTDFVKLPSHVKRTETLGLRQHLGLPAHYRIFLDNGAFHTLSHDLTFDSRRYKRLVDAIKPDWYPIPIEHIPHPSMSSAEQERLFDLTMRQNVKYAGTSFVPVMHVGECLPRFLRRFETSERKGQALDRIGLGAMVPFLLRSKGADGRTQVIDDIISVRRRFPKARVHGFGIGGTATIHLATILGLDSVDSAGWRNRAARGIIQLAGTGDRIIGEFGTWRGRRLSPKEWKSLKACPCPACSKLGVRALKQPGLNGFAARATHNLFVLIQELRGAASICSSPDYPSWLDENIDNRIYLPLLKHAHAEYVAPVRPEVLEDTSSRAKLRAAR